MGGVMGGVSMRVQGRCVVGPGSGADRVTNTDLTECGLYRNTDYIGSGVVPRSCVMDRYPLWPISVIVSAIPGGEQDIVLQIGQ